MKIYHPIAIYFFFTIITGILIPNLASSQINRSWDYSFNPPNNYEASGNCITVLPSGKTITGGIYKSSTGTNRNTLLLIDKSGNFLDVDTSNPGFGYRKVIYDGNGNIFAAATLNNDSLPINKIVVARFDTTFSNRQFFVPDSITTFPGYDVLDMTLLSNSTIVVASHWDAFPIVSLSLLCMDFAGNVLWERIDSSFEFSYDVKLLPDSSGGLFVAGSGRDTSTSTNFIFAFHYSSSGVRDWSVTHYSPQPFADMNDIVMDINKNIYISGIIMDSVGQEGILMKLDTIGNVLWNKSILPLPYSRLTTDNHGNIYGAVVPQNGLDVLTIEKLDSSGTFINSTSFQSATYFTSDLGDFRMLENGIIAATGGLYVLSFPKTDLYIATFDTSLSLLGYDIYNSQNLLGEKGNAISEVSNSNVYVCGRFNFENQFETSNIGVAKYDLSGIINGVKTKTTYMLQFSQIHPQENSRLNFRRIWITTSAFKY
ncbi:MAG: hypothetical protein IPH33_15080 [Bacteroidetes bacterium]|nr:hypothetical protein [Bacteroidota bacterium]